MYKFQNIFFQMQVFFVFSLKCDSFFDLFDAVYIEFMGLQSNLVLCMTCYSVWCFSHKMYCLFAHKPFFSISLNQICRFFHLVLGVADPLTLTGLKFKIVFYSPNLVIWRCLCAKTHFFFYF